MTRPISAQICLSHLRHNYQLLRERAKPASIMAVVKADAYGHGLDIVAPELSAEGCSEFAATDIAEGVRLRNILTDDKTSVAVLAGVFDLEDARAAGDYELCPVICSDWQLDLLRDSGFTGRVWLKVETGMHRLGAHDAKTLYEKISQAGITVVGIMSHLACADTPDHSLNAEQKKNFARIHAQLDETLSGSLLNSAGIAAMAEQHWDVVRPGIALYGVEPATGMKLGFKPVMHFSSQIIHIQNLSAGDSVSYGATFTARDATCIAVVAAGYSDGLPRSLSNHGNAIWRGIKLPIIGRVCMDYCMLDMGGHFPNIGDDIEFWGEELPASEVARQAGTISYELFTGVNARVPRQAVETFT